MNAFAQSLPPVAQSSGIDWFLLLGIAAIVGVVVLIIWFKHKNPAAAAVAGSVVSADASHLGTVIVDEFAKLRTALEAKIAPAPAPSAEPAAPPAPAGKSGQAGVFTATVTGDPAVDLPALMAQYSAK